MSFVWGTREERRVGYVYEYQTSIRLVRLCYESIQWRDLLTFGSVQLHMQITTRQVRSEQANLL